MHKFLKPILLLGFVFALCMGLFAFTACGGGDDSPRYTITVNETENGEITASATEAKEGDEITLTATPDSGYRLDELSINGSLVLADLSEGNTYTFTMPDENVVVDGTFVSTDVPVSYYITIDSGENGTVSADKERAAAGETVTLTVTPDWGYELDSLKVDGTETAVTGGVATFVMPSANVQVAATFVQSDVTVESIPAETAFEINAKALAGSSAASSWVVTFEENSLKVEVYVKDETVKAGDAVAAYFGNGGFEGATLSANNHGIKIASTGIVTGYTGTDSSYTEGQTDITASLVPWGEEQGTVDGYKATIVAPYSAIGFTDMAAAKGSVTVLPVLYNTDNTFGAREGTIENGSINEPGTYPVFSDTNTWSENYYLNGIGQLGDGSAVSMGRYWDLSKDYAAEDTENYKDREVKLTGHDVADNNIVFFRGEGDTLYAEATFRVVGVLNNEKWGKFGIMLFDGDSKTGVFFYVDAYIGDDKDALLQNISGTSLGYNIGTGNWGAWNSIPGTTGSFDTSTYTVTLAMTYCDNVVSMYCGDNLVYQTTYTPAGDLQIGFKSFAYQLTVTDYTMSDDPESDIFKEHNPPMAAQEIDVLFAGDSYMEFLIRYGVYDELTADIAAKANVGVGGTQVPYWTDTSRVGILEKQYDPEKIVFHIGVNDINGAGRSADQVYADLQTLFGLYHTSFPDAQIYWVSLIPNTLHPNNTAKYVDLNSQVETLAESTDYLNYIDATTAFTSSYDDNDIPLARPNVFKIDGLHLNEDYGYPLWMKIIKDALGYTTNNGDTFGYNASYYMPTAGWTYGAGTATNTGDQEAVTYYNKLQYSSDIYLELDIKSTETYNSDPYPKVGLILRNDEMTLFAYLDLEPALLSQGNVNIVYRGLTSDGKGMTDWSWSNTAGAFATQQDCTQDFVHLGFGKLGNIVFVTIDGVKVLEWDASGATAADKFVAGVLGFNSKIEVQSATGTNVASEIQEIYNGTAAQ